uniref:Uncharacterized protein n=1 Tax=Tanacetum cinerariifolium TaxID=118510 RepID=A0A699HS52_TANCI|nr:hypothetical protein [Tanacetum cinerariifolium]
MSPTKHVFCIWHITSKFSGSFNSFLEVITQVGARNFIVYINWTPSKNLCNNGHLSSQNIIRRKTSWKTCALLRGVKFYRSRFHEKCSICIALSLGRVPFWLFSLLLFKYPVIVGLNVLLMHMFWFRLLVVSWQRMFVLRFLGEGMLQYQGVASSNGCGDGFNCGVYFEVWIANFCPFAKLVLKHEFFVAMAVPSSTIALKQYMFLASAVDHGLNSAGMKILQIFICCSNR